MITDKFKIKLNQKSRTHSSFKYLSLSSILLQKLRGRNNTIVNLEILLGDFYDDS